MSCGCGMLWNEGTMKVGVVGSWIRKSVSGDLGDDFRGDRWGDVSCGCGMLWNEGTMKVGIGGSSIRKSIAVDRNNRFPFGEILPCETRAAVAAANFASDDAC